LKNCLFLGGDFDDLGKIDGVDQWKSLIETSKRMRSMILINIDETRGEEALIFNQWKVVKSKKSFFTCLPIQGDFFSLRTIYFGK